MGLELSLLGAAFWYLNRHVNDCEKISVRRDKICVEIVEGNKTRFLEFDRYWARVILERDENAKRIQLVLRSRGNEILLGKNLAQAQRIALGKQLARAFSNLS